MIFMDFYYDIYSCVIVTKLPNIVTLTDIIPVRLFNDICVVIVKKVSVKSFFFSLLF